MTIVDREAAQPPMHEPDVAAVEEQDVRPLDVHAVIQGSYLVPPIRRLDAHAALLRSQQADVPDGTIRAPAAQEGATAPSRASSSQTIEPTVSHAIPGAPTRSPFVPGGGARGWRNCNRPGVDPVSAPDLSTATLWVCVIYPPRPAQLLPTPTSSLPLQKTSSAKYSSHNSQRN